MNNIAEIQKKMAMNKSGRRLITVLDLDEAPIPGTEQHQTEIPLLIHKTTYRKL
ncbi:hypothetical protein [Klebsiella michiganensis]|uniref:hypothetical protein n=1 Tax=Klebsiella michiganensis TaxID=1134687 RepID=UPI003F4F72C8